MSQPRNRASQPHPQIAVVGSINMDLVTYAPRIPGAGETLLGERFEMGFGGKGANQAVMARLLGAGVRMVGCVGDDTYGSTMIDNLAAYGIDTTRVARTKASSGVAHIWVEPDGTNRILVVPGANHTVTPGHAAKAIENGPRLSVVVGQLEILQPATAAAFRAAQRQGALTVLNPAPAAPLDQDLLEFTDWLVPNEGEFTTLAGIEPNDDALRDFAAASGVGLVVTLGEAGAVLVDRRGAITRVPAPRVDAVDTTAAGDAFVAGFAYGLAAGWPEVDAVRLGVEIATDTVTRTGAQSSFPPAARCQAISGSIRP